MISRFFTLLLLGLLLSGCWSPPDCPQTVHSSPAVSAGCMVIENHKLLVAQTYSGVISIPGGSANGNEFSHCTAHRETWEETGLSVEPTELIRIFDNGFHLYRCRWHGKQGETSAPFVVEIEKAFWITAEQFDQFRWRFPEQAHWLKERLENDETLR